jgi:hypothetical protein
MLNISWGTRIAALYIGFVLLIGAMVFMSMNQKIDLVSPDYYEKELAFQTKITEMNNANALSEKIKHVIGAENLEILFPLQFKDKTVCGNINLFRPSDATLDLKLQLNLTDLEFTVPLKDLRKGMYKMQLSWSADNIPYFIEEIIVIP